MKWIAITLMSLTALVAILYLAIGGLVLAIILGTIGLTTLIIIIFSLGIWYAHQSIKLGANLAIQATIYRQTKDQPVKDTGWPPLLEEPIDASFTIQGIDEGE